MSAIGVIATLIAQGLNLAALSAARAGFVTLEAQIRTLSASLAVYFGVADELSDLPGEGEEAHAAVVGAVAALAGIGTGILVGSYVAAAPVLLAATFITIGSVATTQIVLGLFDILRDEFGILLVPRSAIFEDTATEQADILIGKEVEEENNGQDTIAGLGGDDQIHGLSGDDVLRGNRGDDEIRGGDGNDVLVGGLSEDLLIGGEGDDILHGGDLSPVSPASIDNSDDILYGDDPDDESVTGDDTLTGGLGSDQLFGGPGNDILFGDFDTNQTFSNLGDDFLDGGTGDDILVGSGGNDELFGGEGDDFLSGGSGVDRLFGGPGIDNLDGGADNDIINGGEDADFLDGGTGSDLFIVTVGDTIRDPENGDRVQLNGQILGEVTQDDEGRYIGNQQEEYFDQGVGLRIALAGGAGTIVIQNWDNANRNAGITLTPDEDQGGFDGTGGGGDNDNDPSHFASPLVLDLDGDGLELIDLNASGAIFDIDRDGFAERMGWVAPDDGLLALDRDLDGAIDDVGELFGAGFVAPSLSLIDSLPEDASGFATLGELDTNFDGTIDAGDAQFADLLVWQDGNGDGVSTPGELVTLADQGIVAIDLDRTNVDQMSAGNLIAERSTYTRADATTGDVSDVWFAYNPNDTRELDTNVAITPEIAVLPNLTGFGEVSNLDVAMARDPLLQEMVEELAALPVAEAHLLSSKVEAIIYRWHGVEDVSPESRGPNVNGQHLAVVETLQGFEFRQLGSLPNPRAKAGEVQENNWIEYLSGTTTKLLAQIPLGQTLIPGLDLGASVFLGLPGSTTVTNLLSGLEPFAPTGLSEKAFFWQSMALVTESLITVLPEDADTIEANFEATLLQEGLNFTFDQILRAQIGDAGDDVLSTTTPNAVLFGGEGDDLLQATKFNGTILFDRGQGQDVVRSEATRTEVQLLDADRSEVTISRGTDPLQEDLVISIDGTSDEITIEGFFRDDFFRLDQIEFADGETIRAVDIIADTTVPTDGDDVLAAPRVLSTVLDGGLGDDTLIGQEGNDTFVFAPGYGNDTVIEDSLSVPSTDTVDFQGGLTLADLSLSRSADPEGQDLIIGLTATGDTLTISEQFTQFFTPVESFTFDDGSSATIQELTDIILAGTPGDDVVVGTQLSDTLGGDAGDDVLKGAEDGDVYLFGIGAGQDRVVDPVGTNRVDFGVGIAPGDLALSQVPGSTNLLVGISGQADSLTIAGFLSYPNGGVQEFRFDDGTIWDRATIEAQLPGDAPGAIAVSQYIEGSSASNSFDLGNGYDVLELGAGNDVLTFGRGHDVQVVFASGGFKIVQFEAGITPDDIIIESGVLGRIGDPDIDDVQLRIKDTGDTLALVGALNSGRFDEFHFADGTIWTQQDLIGLYYAGTPGDDFISADDGNQILDGGILGDDRLSGGAGNDTYMFGRGYGQDTIVSLNGVGLAGFDRVVFDGTVTLADVTVEVLDQDVLPEYWAPDNQLRITIDDTGDSLTLLTANAVEEYEFSDGTILTFPDMFALGVDGDNFLHDEFLNLPVIDGGGGNDTIVGGTISSDVIAGGPGDDFLQGLGGNDEYRFNLGDGQDVIDESTGFGFSDKLVFGAGIVPADINLSPEGRDLVLSIDGTADQVTIRDQLSPDVADAVDTIEFDDGTIWTRAQVLAMVNADPAGDNLVIGTAGDDILDGQGGNDHLEGEDGNDTYVFGPGSGEDIVLDTAGTADRVLFAAGILPTDVTASRATEGVSLRLDFAGLSDSLTIQGGVETLEFDDGTIRTLQEVIQPLLDADTTSGDDTLTGLPGDVTLNGGAGNDGYVTFDGNTVEFGPGAGQDVILANATGVTIRFAAGLVANDITLTRLERADGGTDLEIDLKGAGDTLLIENQFEPAHHVASFVFDDGTTWTQIEMQRALFAANITARDDVLIGSDGDDTTDGGAGDDLILGGEGDDVYVFGFGSGHDTIRPEVTHTGLNYPTYEDRFGTDQVHFGPGITFDDLTVTIDKANSVTVALPGTDDSLTFETIRAFGGAEMELSVQTFVFDDGSMKDVNGFGATSFLQETYAPSSGDDVVDSGRAFTGNSLDGGAGDDYFIGSSQLLDDYLYGRGSGNDTIDEDGAGFIADTEFDPDWSGGGEYTDTIQFTADILTTDITLLRGGHDLNDLVVEINDTGERLTIIDQFDPFAGFDAGALLSVPFVYAGIDPVDDATVYDVPGEIFYFEYLAYQHGIDEFHFDDGTVWNREEIALQVTGSELAAGDNTLTTDDAGGTLDGAEGTDMLMGGTGDDVYIFDLAYDEDEIVDAGGFDEIQFAAGVPLADLHLTRLGEAGEDLLIEVGGLDRLTLTLRDQFGKGDGTVERFTFDDGTVLSDVDVQNLMLDRASTEQGDVIEGFRTDDILEGRGGADTLTGGKGDDILLGGEGRDVAVFSGAAGDYAVVDDGTKVTVTDLRPDGDGEDTLYGVEDLRFGGDPAGTDDAHVVPENQASTAGDDSDSGTEDTDLVISLASLLANDSDPEGAPLNLVSVQNATNGTAFINLAGNVTFRPDADFNGAASFDYMIADPDGATATANVALTFAAVNDAPRGVTLSNASLAEDAAGGVVVGTVQVDDPDTGDSHTYALLADANGLFTIDTGTGVVSLAPAAALDFETAPSHDITVEITDAAGETVSDIFTIAVTDVNEAPESLSLLGGTVPDDSSAGTVVGTALASDPDVGDFVTFSLDDDAQGRFLINAVSGDILVAPGVDLDPASHDVIARATDSQGLFATQTFTLTVEAVGNSAPTDLDLVGSSVDEGVLNGIVVGTIAVTDPDVGDTFTFALPDDAAGRFAIDASGTVTVADGSLLDHEAADAHSITVEVTDSGGEMISEAFSISVNDVNEVPTASDGAFGIDENQTAAILGTVEASDPDDASEPFGTLSYAITAGNAAGLFSIDGATGEISTTGPLDHEAADSHVLAVTATDGDGLSDTAQITVSVNDVNESPTATDAAFAIDENQAAAVLGTVTASDPDDAADPSGTLSYAITAGNDDNAFSIDDATGELSTTGPLDHEAAANRALTVTVTDGGGLSDTAQVDVTVGDLNEQPTATDAAFAIDENQAAVALGLVRASDPDDGSEPFGTLSYAITAGNDAGLFVIDSATGELSTTGALDHEAADSHIHTVTITDGDGLSDTAQVTVSANDVNETPTATDAAFAIDENQAAAVLGLVLASDPDDGGKPFGTLTYAITAGDDDGLFAIDAATGELSTTGPLDHDTAASHLLTVSVSDGGGLSDDAKVTVTVNDASETGITLSGGNGDDVLIGTPNADVLSGENGNDTLIGLADNDTLDGGKGDDELFGDEGDDILNGDSGIDQLSGGEGDDVLNGGKAADILLGGAGDDQLDGEDGNDILDPGMGIDQLLGGDGADTIVFRQGYGDDTVQDFSTAFDVIDLDGFGLAILSEVLAVTVQDGADALINLDADDSLRLVGVDKNDLQESNFSLVA